MTDGKATDQNPQPCGDAPCAGAPQATPTPTPKPVKKIAIVGCSDSKSLAPYDDAAWEIWAMNNAYANTKRWTQWFEIHPIKFEDGHFMRRNLIRPGVFKWDRQFRGYEVDRYIRDLASLDCTVWMQQHWEAIPKSKPYPLQEVITRFGNYFTNSVSFMIVLAIMQGATEIGCYGVDMATGCPAPDVKVLRGDLRWVPAGSLNVGDEVISFDEMPSDSIGNTRRWKKAFVTACPKIKKPCYHLTMEDGTEMIVSENHGWLTHAENENRWRRQLNLVTPHHRHDRPSRIVKVLDVWEDDRTWEAGYLAGAFDNEGHISQMPRKRENYPSYTHGFVAGFAQKKNAMSNAVEQILEKYGFSCRMNETNGTRKYRINGGKAEIIRLLGTVRPQRLLEKFDADILGQLKSKETPAVIKSEYIGEHDVIGLETSSKTFIAEGYASHNSEYGPQRPSCEFFLGVAAGMGITITIPDEADLLKTRFLYGFGEREQTAWEAKMMAMQQNLEMRKQKAANQAALQQKMVDQYIGAQMASAEIHRIWSNLADTKTWKDKV